MGKTQVWVTKGELELGCIQHLNKETISFYRNDRTKENVGFQGQETVGM